MTPMTLMTLILISLMTFTNATTTNATIYTPNMIVSYVPVEYSTTNGDVGYLTMPSYTYINVSSTIDDCPNDALNTVSFFTELFGFICYIYSYKYLISNVYFIIVNTRNFIKYLETIEPEFTIPTIDIKEEIMTDTEDDYDNQSVYTTSNNYSMVLFHQDGVKINDIAYKGSCYIEIHDSVLFTYNYSPIKFNNITYKQLLTIASLSKINRFDLALETSSINIDPFKTYKGVQVITFK